MKNRLKYTRFLETLLNFKIDVFPPSTNHLQHTDYRSRVRYDTKEYKDFKAKTQRLLEEQDLPDLSAYADKPLSLIVLFHWSEWLSKKGEIRKNRDVSNRYKAIEDAIFKAVGIDDSRNVLPVAIKQPPQGGCDKYVTVCLLAVE